MAEQIEGDVPEAVFTGRSHKESKARRHEVGRYAREHGIKAAMAHFRVSETVVRRGLAEVGGRNEDVRAALRNSEEVRAVAAYARDNGVGPAMKEYGLSEYKVLLYCTMQCVVPLPKRKRAGRTLVVIARLQAGERQVDVARSMGVSSSFVSDVKKLAVDAGIKFPGGDDAE